MKRNSLSLAIWVFLGVTAVAAANAQPPEHGGADRGRNLERLMERFDANGDGVLGMDEFQEPPRAWARFDDADANDDGMVTMAEIETRISERADAMLAKAAAMFVEADLDGDGAVTEDERRAAVFNRIDSNADGVLTVDELAAMQEERREHRGERSRRDR
jgi:Ca2+-binding EF-hand superfamily protein